MSPDTGVHTYHTAIIGGGLAGLATTWALTERDIEPDAIAILDARNSTRGSSSPCGMLHAFPGRSLAPDGDTFDKLRTSLSWIRRVADLEASDDSELYRPTTMLRPVDFDAPDNSKRKSWERTCSSYPDWFASEWLDPTALADRYPAVRGEVGAVHYDSAMTVAIDRVRRALRRHLGGAGVAISSGVRVERVERRDGTWQLSLDDGESVTTRRIVWACGHGLEDWFDLPAGPRAGEVAILRPPSDAHDLKAAVSAGGYVAPSPASGSSEDRRWLAGATWFDPEELDARTDRRAVDEIREKVSPIVPAVERSEPLEVWRGVRFMLGHIAGPLVGRIPKLPAAFVAGAFGSKGLLRIPWCAERLAAVVVDAQTSAPASIRADRIEERWWSPNGERIAGNDWS